MQKNSDSLFEILHLNIFSTSIIQEKNTNLIIQMFIKTLISLEKFKKKLKNLKIENKLNNFLLKVFTEEENIKNYNEEINKYNEKNIEYQINDNFSLLNYKNILKFLEEVILEKKYLVDVLEYCIINALICIFCPGKEITFNLYVYDNFNKMKRISNYEYLLKNSFEIDILNAPFKQYINENKELMYDESKKIFEDKNKKVIEVNPKLKELFTSLGENNTDIIKNFFDLFNKNIENIIKIIQEDIIINNIIPLIYLGTISKFQKLKEIYLTFQMNNDLINYFYNEIQKLYYNPKSSFNYLFYILFTVNKIKNSSQINLEKIPFKFDLSQAFIEEENSIIISSSLKFDNRIKEIILNQNKFGIGFYELGKNLYFNKNINKLNFGQMNLNQSQLRYFYNGLIEQNFSIIEFNLFQNIKIDYSCGEIIGKILYKFPNLIILNLNKCNLSFGLKYILKNILIFTYQKRTKLKKLYLSNVNMDEISIKILSNIVSQKNCQIEILSVNNNNFGNKMGKKFLREMTYNNSIQELYMYNCNLDDSFLNEIKNLILFGNLNIISFYKNKISNFESILKTISLCTINKNNNFNCEKKLYSQLNNLDFGYNSIKKENICDIHITILEEIIENIDLDNLDISQIINGQCDDLPSEDKIVDDKKNRNIINENKYIQRVKNLNETIKKLIIKGVNIYF